ncbi:hypothetical protein BU16DRAFT_522789 [Lophium mytilinum]|uniref:Zn(2)-C6 fungal-type domain-containing protein n=1 Tax=Lophium mytilinum TaxID=390894 RepID=A0A6A6RAT2_9PEZI|nr:hypothetical protein BU16DRAFT_522789 [Lophium mytilinum]
MAAFMWQHTLPKCFGISELMSMPTSLPSKIYIELSTHTFLDMADSNLTSSRVAAKSQRVLACVLCQQRKVKCNRKFPCTNCEKAGAQCVPATLAPRHRRRRFPERELLERLRDYEGLLRQNNIKFEPLHASIDEKPSPSLDGKSYDSADEVLLAGRAATADRPKNTIVKSETVYEPKNFWHAMNQRVR